MAFRVRPCAPFYFRVLSVLFDRNLVMFLSFKNFESRQVRRFGS